MKVLYFTSKPPYPTIDGGCFASSRFLECLLDADFEVKHFTIATDKHPFEIDEYPEEIIRETKPESIYINTRINPLKAVKGLFARGSYNVNRFYSIDAEQRLIELLSEDVELIILDSLYATPYLDALRKHSSSKIFLRAHNVEYLIWEELAENSRVRAKKVLFRKLAKDLKQCELETLPKLDGIFAISPEDLEHFKSLELNNKLSYIPIQVEIPDLLPDYEGNDLFHVGSMFWEPNIQSVETLMSWLPELKKRHPDLRLHLAGSGLNGKYKKEMPSLVVEDGFVEDLNAYASKRGMLVAPIQSGSGVRVKILEMMALGIPIVTTSKGAQGIKDKSAVRLADTKEDFLNAITELINSKDQRISLGTRGRSFIKEEHEISKIVQLLKDAIK